MPEIVLEMVIPEIEDESSEDNLFKRQESVPLSVKPIDLLLPETSSLYFSPVKTHSLHGSLKF